MAAPSARSRQDTETNSDRRRLSRPRGAAARTRGTIKSRSSPHARRRHRARRRPEHADELRPAEGAPPGRRGPAPRPRPRGGARRSSPTAPSSSSATAARRSPPPRAPSTRRSRSSSRPSRRAPATPSSPRHRPSTASRATRSCSTATRRSSGPRRCRRCSTARAEGAAVVVLGFETDEPGGYGRLIVDEAGLAAIVEARDATPEQRAIRLCNSGILAADAALLLDLLAGVEPDNAKGEYYLTDVVGLARAAGLHATAITCPEEETLGVNSRTDLAAAEAAFQARARAEALANGTTLVDPGSVWFALDTVVGRDVVIEPERLLRPRGDGRVRGAHPRLLPPDRLPHQPRRRDRALRPPPPRRRDRRGRAHRQLRRGQELDRRGGRQGQPPQPTSATPASGRGATSAPAPSPATTTASSSTAPRSASAPSSARTPPSSRR